ncbi:MULTISPECIES: hypothetical protein [Kribbella]|uniref:WD40 repeat domain-containing protein n=1 Tax=Kribbella karoonensis TaxID=324851 RepID=A0ABN2DCN6_9ACTN
MNALLKDAFTEEAAAAGEPNLDLGAIVGNGRRRVRRRRITTLVAAVTAVVAIAGGVTVVRETTRTDSVVQPAGAFAEVRATWASGKVIHYGGTTYESPVAIASFVQTTAGFLVAGADGTVYVLDGNNPAAVLGRGDTSKLLAAEGPVAGWVDTRPAVPEFVLYDVGARRELVRTAEGNDREGDSGRAATGSDPLHVVAIDGGTAYLAASDGLRRLDVATGRNELIKPGARTSFLQAARGGQLVWEHPAENAGNDLAVAMDLGAKTPGIFEGWHPYLSPSGRYLLTDKADEIRMFDVATGRQLPLTFAAYALIMPTQWSSEDAFYAVGYRATESEPVDLLSCSVASGSCAVAVPGIASSNTAPSRFQVPIGVPIG